MKNALVEFLKLTPDVPKALIGSLNLQLQGIDTKPNDIDFLTNDEGLIVISEKFGGKIFVQDVFKACEFEFYGQIINCCSCERNSLRSCDFMDKLEFVKVDGLEVPCLSLESELEFYRSAGRESDLQKVNKIENILKAKI